MDEQQNLLLSDKEADEHGHSHSCRREKRFLGRVRQTVFENPFFSLYALVIHMLLLGVLSSAIVHFLTGPKPAYGDNYSPAHSAIRYIQRPEPSTSHEAYSIYSGPPTKENTQAWEKLIEPTFFAATEEEVRLSGDNPDEAVKLADGGYLAALGVYHEIHCLRQLRLFLHSETYYPNLTTANIKYLQGHLGHCIELLRQSLSCSASTALYTFRWEDSEPDRPLPRSSAVRQCKDWGSLEQWSQKRKVALEPILLREDGVGEKIHL